eukprot:1442494-Prymnesium_polylepis.1
MLLDMLPDACAAPRSSAEYFDGLRALMASQTRRLYAVARGTLRKLCALIDAEARAIRAQEGSSMVDMAQGGTLRTLLELLSSCLELPT